MKNISKPILVTLSLLLGIFLFLLVIYIVGWQNTIEALKTVGWEGAGMLFCCIIGQIIFFTLTWHTLLQSAGFSIPFHWVWIAQLMGYTGNIITPSMYLGGEPLAAYFLAKHQDVSTRKVFGTMVTSKVTQLLAFIVFFIVGSSIALVKYSGYLPGQLRVFVLVVNAVLFFGTFWLLYLFIRGKHILTKLVVLLSRMRIFPKFMLRMKPKVRDVEKTVHQAFSGSWKGTLLALVFSVGAMSVIFFRPLAYLFFVPGSTMTIVQASAFFSLSQVIQMLQFTPGGLGIFDAATVFLFKILTQAKSPEPLAMGFNILYRASDALVVGIGVCLIFYIGFQIFLGDNPIHEEQATN